MSDDKMMFRVERVEWAEIEVDVPGLIAEWGALSDSEEWDREAVSSVLYQIGVQDLTYSGDFIRVIDKDTDETIA